VLVGMVVGGCLRIDAETHKSSSILASLEIPAELRTALDTNPDRRLYFQEVGHYEIAQYYAPAAVRDRITLVYSVEREIRFDRHDTESLTAENLSHFSALPIVRYEQILADPSPHIFALYDGGWDWTDPAFAEDHAVVKPITPWFDGQAALVTFPQSFP
jgi:bifunctional DNA-binding transcriptional regulator/antitoxin component of YhaV-PrlF toxin-antitoxin module